MSDPRPSHANPNGGFSLTEVAVALCIVGLLAALALPVIETAVRRVRVNAVANDLRVFSDAFRLHLAQTAQLPPTQPVAATTPAGMEAELGTGAWQRRTPLGGRYRWEQTQALRGEVLTGCIVIEHAGENRVRAGYEQLSALDRLLDDGNLLTGALRVTQYPQLVLILQ